ncbi:LIP-domain-containing protein [Thozetella sp. PMI_491]|nr:LIP-domain-containing protein [Thozetella sp. PMI_491]
MPSFCNLVVAGLWVGLSRALPLAASEPIPPSQDPWYTAPCGFEEAAPGAVLRLRSAPGNLTSIIGNSSAAYHVLYRTTDTQGQPSFAVTTLIAPNTTNSESDDTYLISYQPPYDTAAVDGSPSYALYNLLFTPNAFIPIPETYYLGLLLGRGWFVTVPDYEGPLASFIEGPQAAHATLDAVRASSSLRHILGTSDVHAALWGYSGGGYATAWAAELQPQYAPELKLSGAAAGGIPTDIFTILPMVNKTPLTGNLISSVIGLVSQFPEANATLASQLKTDGPYNATGFFAATKRNFLENAAVYAYQDVTEYFIGGVSPLDIPAVKDLVPSQTILGVQDVPEIPYFVFGSILDEAVGIAGMDALVDKYCAEGANILFQRNTVGSHGAEVANSIDRVFNFLESSLDGSFSLQGCKVENVTVAVNTTSDSA